MGTWLVLVLSLALLFLIVVIVAGLVRSRGHMMWRTPGFKIFGDEASDTEEPLR